MIVFLLKVKNNFIDTNCIASSDIGSIILECCVIVQWSIGLVSPGQNSCCDISVVTGAGVNSILLDSVID